MRTLFRNAQFRRESAAFITVAAIFATAGFAVEKSAGTAVTLCALALYALYLGFSLRRYRQMSRLADELDRLLHGQGSFDLDRYSEGELSILQSELSKLLVTLRRQSDSLKADKIWLADSLADISHQLKTPLTSLNLAAAMLSEPELAPERRRELSRDVSRQLTRLEWLVSALLKLSRLDAGTAALNPVPTPVRPLLDTALDPIRIPLEVLQIALRIDCPEGVTAILDPDWAAEALGNILKNCMEHTPPGGTVTVAARENAVLTEIVISDTGPGIDPEDLPHIFERFYRGKSADPGSAGIGLALASTIIRASGGTVKAENGPNGGARFEIKLYKSTV